ncbi:MAG: hypothetical protein E7A62_09740 [Actinomycetaceae bacterium]|nr:hypothetical protein [Actinomycetaceae bacterium]MDU0971250.1 hypothetical protein [Actinomycetaceae bacterium]
MTLRANIVLTVITAFFVAAWGLMELIMLSDRSGGAPIGGGVAAMAAVVVSLVSCFGIIYVFATGHGTPAPEPALSRAMRVNATIAGFVICFGAALALYEFVTLLSERFAWPLLLLAIVLVVHVVLLIAEFLCTRTDAEPADAAEPTPTN